MLRLLGIRKRSTKRLEPDISTVFDADKDNVQLLNIFPRETWLRIAKKLKARNDTINLSNSAAFFGTLLSSQRVQFLFKDVLQVVAHQSLLGEFYYDHRDNIHNYGNESEAKSFILNSRLVCHSWNKAVCQLAAQMESEWTCGLRPRQNNAIHHLFRTHFQISNLPQVTRFLATFGDLSTNPFFNRTILITLTPHEMTPQNKRIYHYLITELLLKFGNHLWNCIFHEAFCLDENEEAYSVLIRLLNLMPNLKHLELINRTVNTCAPENFPVPPKLENLKSLIFYSIYTPVCNAIVEANPHVSRLFAEHPGYNEDVFWLSYPFPFPNLEQLELSYWSWREMRVLGASTTIMWPLKKLKLHFREHPRIDIEPITWFELFDILSKCFGGTLEELELNLPIIRGTNQIEQIQRDSPFNILRLPKLKKLDLIVKNPANFGFLLGTAGSLQNLRIEVRAFEDELLQFWRNRHRQNIQIRGMYNDVLQSNIWRLFPNLQSVKIRVWNLGSRFYSRSEWTQMQQTRNEPRTRHSSWKKGIVKVLAYF